MIVEAGGCELPLSVAETSFVKSGSIVCSDVVTKLIETPLYGFSVSPKVPSQLYTIYECPPELSKMEFDSTPDTSPPAELLTGMRPDCHAAFRRMWERIPAHLRDINFGL